MTYHSYQVTQVCQRFEFKKCWSSTSLLTSFILVFRSPYPAQNYANQQPYQPAQPAAYYQPRQPTHYVQPAPRPYNYRAAESRNTLRQGPYSRQPFAQALQRKAPQVQKPQERTWVDKMGVKWTTRKVNDYKWGEREPGITMDEYAGGPFGFDDVKRSHIQRAQFNQVHY